MGQQRRYVLLEPDVIELYRQGLTCHEVGRELGMSHHKVNQILIERGIPRRAHGQRAFCRDCQRPITQGQRCDYHKKTRHAQIAREFRRAKFNVPRDRWRADY